MKYTIVLVHKRYGTENVSEGSAQSLNEVLHFTKLFCDKMKNDWNVLSIVINPH